MKRTKKIFAVLLILSILIIQIDSTKRNAEAFAAVVIPIVDVAPEIVAAIMTLIAGGMVIHNDDLALRAAKAYVNSGQTVGQIENGVIVISSAAAQAASTWLQTWVPTVGSEVGYYEQTVGRASDTTDADSIDWTASTSTTFFNAIPLNDGRTYINIDNFIGIRDWVLAQSGEYPDDHRIAQFIMSSLGSGQYFKVQIAKEWIGIESEGFFTYIGYTLGLDSVSKLRFTCDRVTESGKDIVRLNIQTYDELLMQWNYPSDSPFIEGLNPDAVSLSLNTDSAVPISTTWDIPLSWDATDITYNPAEPRDITTAIPTDWTGILDKTADDIATTTPTDPPVDEPTSILDWLAKLWAWIQEFWAWIKSIPQLIADAIAAEFVIGPNDTIDFTKLKFAAELFTNKFPFSLPWDLKNMVMTFGSGSTAAPVIPIEINGVKADIDLSKFNSLAAAVRVLELFAFSGGLLFGTRKLLGGAS